MKKPTILFVDDDLDLLRLGASILEREGFRVTTASSAEQAARTAFSTFPDLVITDVMMPGESGYSLCERLRADASTADTPVIFFTFVEGEREALQAGATSFVSKPLVPKELLAAVHAALQPEGDRRPLDEALELARQERFDEALERLGALAEAHPGQNLGDWAAYHRACLLERLGEFPASVTAHRELLGRTPDFWRSHNRLGQLCRRTNQIDKAIRHHRRSLQLNPAQPDVEHDLELLESIHRDRSTVDAEFSGTTNAPQGEGVGDFGAADEPAPTAPPAGSRGDVLVADDDPDITNLMSIVLKAAGYTVRVVHDGDAAQDAVRARRPDLVILDGLMPGSNGFDTALAIKQEICADDPPKIILITAIYTKMAQRHEACSHYKVDEVVAKPIMPDRLLALVESQLGAKAETPELAGATA